MKIEDYMMAMVSYLNGLNIKDKSLSFECEEACWDDYKINKQVQFCQRKLQRR